MNLLGYAQKLKEAANALKQEAPNIVRRNAMDMKATVERRIISEGIPGKSYSENPIPYYYTSPNAINNRGKQKVRGQHYDTYKQFRERQGLQTSHVDLKLSGRMWAAISVLGVTAVRENVHRAQIGTTDQETDDKLRYNLERYGDFLKPTSEEEAELYADAKEEITDLIKRLLA